PILCIHGMMDYRIPYEQGMAAFNAAQMMGVPSRLVVFPEENHWILQPQNSLYWHREFYGWLEKWCNQATRTCTGHPP
ncbi:MAG: prolyl oligopeptidase family serine peptidase, partial [Bacteroidales bacterium]|nr:prolyl oligopeptidase family serine peptidase [Bacteroidales bacterium]